MTRTMIGPLFLLAASAMATPSPAPAVAEAASAFQPTSKVSVRTRVSIRIVSAASFGPSHQFSGEGATRRSGQLVDADGTIRQAELLEFQ